MELRSIIEATLFAARKPLSLQQLQNVFEKEGCPEKAELREMIREIQEAYQPRPIELVEVASGYRFQIREEASPWVSRLLSEKPPKYSRALLETLAIIAYKQPTTRGEIEEIRGVNVSSNIIHTLLEREWIRPVGHKEVPGRPALYATTKQFLDHFNLKSLEQLPALSEVRLLDEPQTSDSLDYP
ncbi:MAG: SMC-Scp complex subunit ScpB [Gammaproteobacteria bacterium]|nr:MAG: SMC-Scp complex subunit ScpB [Gammaproteobacteria bacterium]